MSVQNACLSCEKLKSVENAEVRFKGTIGKICRFCQFEHESKMATEHDKASTFFGTLMELTSDYGYLVIILLCGFVFYSSLQRQEQFSQSAAIIKANILSKTAMVSGSLNRNGLGAKSSNPERAVSAH